MSLDVLDAAFLNRLAVHPRPEPRPRPEPGARGPWPDARSAAPARAGAADPHGMPDRREQTRTTPAAPEVRRSTLAQAPSIEPPIAESPVAQAPSIEPPVAESPVEPLVGSLLAAAAGQWDALADHVETARQRGRRVVAVAGCRAGEGRTTLVRCLAATLRGRGRDVVCATPDDLAVVAAGPDGRGPTHDKRIVLVDSGIWFPPGPIRRSLLQVASLGCEAAILVRRAGTAGGQAWQAALEALGIEVLGEVLTFADDPAAPRGAHA